MLKWISHWWNVWKNPDIKIRYEISPETELESYLEDENLEILSKDVFTMVRGDGLGYVLVTCAYNNKKYIDIIGLMYKLEAR